MSAAATAAGYLYASGRLRGRTAKEGEAQEPEQKVTKPKRDEGRGEGRRELKVAVYEPRREAPEQAPSRPKAAPKIQYRTRRWKPE